MVLNVSGCPCFFLFNSLHACEHDKSNIQITVIGRGFINMVLKGAVGIPDEIGKKLRYDSHPDSSTKTTEMKPIPDQLELQGSNFMYMLVFSSRSLSAKKPNKMLTHVGVPRPVTGWKDFFWLERLEPLFKEQCYIRLIRGDIHVSSLADAELHSAVVLLGC